MKRQRTNGCSTVSRAPRKHRRTLFVVSFFLVIAFIARNELEVPVEPVGTFQAQYFKFLSADPNTIFQFVVFPDRIFLLKVGSALNQIPQILLKAVVGGPVGLKDHASGVNSPSIEQLRELVDKINGEKTLGFTSASVRSREVPLEQVVSVEHRKKGILGRGLHMKLADGEKRFFRFLQPESESSAQKSLSSILRNRFAVR